MTSTALRSAALPVVVLLTLLVAFARSGSPAVRAADPLKAADPFQAMHPLPRSVPSDATSRRAPGIDARTIWSMEPADAAPRGTSCVFDNGLPLDDFGDPASQWSENQDDPAWNFIGAAADDFMLGNPGDTDLCRITMIRAAFFIADDGSGTPTPTNTWKSVFVTIYPNDVGDLPGGYPDDMGGQTGDYTVSQQVHVSALLNETLVGECRPSYLIDIPVNFLVKRGVKYWLSIVPRHPGPPNQSFWCTSANWMSGDEGSVQYFPAAGPPFDAWTAFAGNLNFCPSTPPAGKNRNLAFRILTAVSEPDVTGACCDDTIGGSGGTCDSESIVDCQRPTQRFAANTLCGNLIPPCGSNDPGACCLPAGTCEDGLTPTQCAQAGGQWFDDLCENLACPPSNEFCEDQLTVSGSNVSFVFDTTNTDPGDGEPLTACGEIVHDIWYSYEVPCDGTVTLSTLGSGFDTVLAVYGPAGACPVDCPTTDFSELTCSDDILDGADSYMVLPANMGECLLIRVGGLGSASQNSGLGVLNIDCIPTGFGACCRGDLECDVIAQAACTAPGDFYTPGQPCSSQFTCPPPCCVGDMDNNCVVDELDILPFVEALLNAPLAGTSAHCRADVNRDFDVNSLDIAPFIDRVLLLASCRIACCPGDTNGDGVLDALDVQGLVLAILSPPSCTTALFCAADVNQDFVIDLSDLDAMVQKLLDGEMCP